MNSGQRRHVDSHRYSLDMYKPRHFQLEDAALQQQLVAQNPLALLAVADPAHPLAAPLLAHLPMVWSRGDAGLGCLEGHLARANPLLKVLQQGQPVRVVFTGADGYVSPALYEDRLNVPTWNYLALEVSGTLRLVDEAMAKDQLLKRLIVPQDPDYVAHWLSLPADFQQKLLGAIVGIQIDVATVDAKAKLSQNRSLKDRQSLLRHFEPINPAMARWMRQLDLVEGL